jgi:pimeloyl-ACP methyl ester carboxylesterase
MTTFVLVHGSWHGGWCWRKLVPLLTEAGHRVYAPTFTGLGERSHLISPQVGLTTFIQDLLQVFEYEDLRDVVLVGHSFGGMVITGVAGPMVDRIARLVYLDAFVPEDGQAMFDLLPPEDQADLRRRAKLEGAGWLMPPYSIDVFGITDPADVAWTAKRLCFMPLLAYEQPVPPRTKAAGSLPRSYIGCTGFPVFDPIRASIKAAGWDYHEIATGHDAMITAPSELAEVLIGIAAT